jgi:hypothetical protein
LIDSDLLEELDENPKTKQHGLSEEMIVKITSERYYSDQPCPICLQLDQDPTDSAGLTEIGGSFIKLPCRHVMHKVCNVYRSRTSLLTICLGLYRFVAPDL